MDIQAEYLAVSEDGRETAHLTQRQVENCTGSAKYSICNERIATDGVRFHHA